MDEKKKKQVIDTLNRILEMELAGTVHYTHYSFMVYGYNRIPIVSWLEQQASESLAHARAAGEMVTQLGAHPSLGIGPLLETQKHDIGDILRESLGHEKATLATTKLLNWWTTTSCWKSSLRTHLPRETAHRRGGQDIESPATSRASKRQGAF
jgi:bacterioferritin